MVRVSSVNPKCFIVDLCSTYIQVFNMYMIEDKTKKPLLLEEKLSYYEKHKEERKNYQRNYFKEHKEKVREYNREYQRQNRKKDYFKTYYETHKEQFRNYERKNERKNRDERIKNKKIRILKLKSKIFHLLGDKCVKCGFSFSFTLV